MSKFDTTKMLWRRSSPNTCASSKRVVVPTRLLCMSCSLKPRIDPLGTKHDDTMDTPRLLVVAVCGPYHFEKDSWFFSDFVMLRGILPHADTDIYLTCVNLDTHERIEKIRAHGEPTAERINMEAIVKDFSWITRVKQHALKSTFLGKLQDTVRTARAIDRVLVVVSGHGAPSGDIGIGEYRRLMRSNDPALLRAEEVYAILKECAGGCTVVVNACASGMWAHKASKLPWSLDDAGVTLLTRGTGSEEIHSHHRSQSGHYCGGFYLNGVAGRLYEEVGLHFPRPDTVDGETIGRFQLHNIGSPSHTVGDINRIKTTPLSTFTTEVGEDLKTLRYPNSVPSAGPPSDGQHPATMFFGIPGTGAVPIRFTSVLPPDPCTDFDAQSVTGSLAGIIQTYLSLQLEDPCASSELFLTQMLWDYRDHKLNWVSKLELRMHLNKRMRLYHKATRFLSKHINDGHEFCPPKGPFQLNDAAHDFLHRSKLISKWVLAQMPMASDWTAVRNLLVICMLQSGMNYANFDSFY